MALVQRPTYDVTLSMVDRDRNVSSVTIHVPTTSLIGAVETWVSSDLIPAVQAISDAVVKSWSINSSAVDDAAVALAPETSDVERKGVFSFRAADGSAYVISVPSILNTLVIDETNLLNKSNVAIVGFYETIVDTSAVTLISPATYLGSDIILLDKAVKTHRGSSRG